MKRKREGEEEGTAGDKNPNVDDDTAVTGDNRTTDTVGSSMNGEIVWQTPSNVPQKQDYIIHNGRRHVRPYNFEFISHVKNRWAGKTIVDLFADEFKGRPYEYYVSAVKCGRIRVDGEMVPVSYIVKTSQKISHFVHRHEPPVMSWDVSILHKEPDVLTVCKPASVPVHPCGQYRKNTVVGILEADYGLAPLFPIHRLDRLVSGLLILARTAAKADFFRQQILELVLWKHNSWKCNFLNSLVGSLQNEVGIEAGMLKKQYIAKVVGIFPEAEQVVDANIQFNARTGKSTALARDASGDTVEGKLACTKFTRISTNGTHSIVLCEPVTGRTHQIRVHLKFAGHPIANDTLYLSELASVRSAEGIRAERAAGNSYSKTSRSDDYVYSPEDFSIDPMCTNCPYLAPNGYEEHEEGLWLHCVKYSGPGWTYECPSPDWASL